jgi:predicted metal-dependent hydrolase
VEGERTVLLRSGAVSVRLRRSSRARRLRLVLVPGVGPELVVPQRTGNAEIADALETLSPWLERALARQRPAVLGLSRPGVAWHGGEAVPLRLVPAPRASSGWNAGALELRAPDPARAAEALERWYRRSAKAELEASVERQAPGLGVVPSKLVVRDQRSRWGSCSRRGTLSFSWRLLLAPAWVLDDVVCHELCHLLIPNHSWAFWSFFAQHRPGEDARPWLRTHAGELAAYRTADSIGAS